MLKARHIMVESYIITKMNNNIFINSTYRSTSIQETNSTPAVDLNYLHEDSLKN